MIEVNFGTDGIRGKANENYLTPEVVTLIGMACGSYFYKPNKQRQLAVIGKDTRLSGYLIEPALTSALVSTGINVLLVGPMPTPAISMLIKSLRADFGIMISASHNQFQDNGIKIFDQDGYKLTKKDETAIETLIKDYPKGNNSAKNTDLGRAKRLDDAPGRYIEYAKNTFPKNLRLSGMKIVVDAANGAAYHLASKIFWELGAEVISIFDNPNGTNINLNCGSMHPEKAIERVIHEKANLGVVLDGDADRILMIDEKGNVANGDAILACIAAGMKSNNFLKNDRVICTEMSNIGFEKFCNSIGVDVVRTNVGDKHVSNELRKNTSNLGGEQSGHIIMSDYSTTGDGIVSALSMLSFFIRSKKKKFSEFCHPFQSTPQQIHSVPIKDTKTNIHSLKKVQSAIDEVKMELGKSGRVNVRNSGTEPLIRIMVEHPEKRVISKSISRIESAIKSELL
ncbi:MAG: phosphoglucosamine mutase [Rickettsiales bacterium]